MNNQVDILIITVNIYSVFHLKIVKNSDNGVVDSNAYHTKDYNSKDDDRKIGLKLLF